MGPKARELGKWFMWPGVHWPQCMGPWGLRQYAPGARVGLGPWGLGAKPGLVELGLEHSVL